MKICIRGARGDEYLCAVSRHTDDDAPLMNTATVFNEIFESEFVPVKLLAQVTTAFGSEKAERKRQQRFYNDGLAGRRIKSNHFTKLALRSADDADIAMGVEQMCESFPRFLDALGLDSHTALTEVRESARTFRTLSPCSLMCILNDPRIERLTAGCWRVPSGSNRRCHTSTRRAR